MLKIETNGTIKLSRGDDVKFPFFLNQGTAINPIRYYLQGPTMKMTTTGFTSTMELERQDNVWIHKAQAEGTYVFSYTIANARWDLTLGQTTTQNVDLAEYGLILTLAPGATITQDCSITIVYTFGDGCEEYFSIFDINDLSTPIFTKTFTSHYDLWHGAKEHFIEDPDDEPTGDMKITLLGTDVTLVKKADGSYCTLAELTPGQYYYQVKAKLLDKYQSTLQEKVYVKETCTNRLPIYLIDDNYDRLWD